MNTIEKLQNLGIDLKNKMSGQHTFICPKCSDQRKKKKERCLSVNIDQGVYNCHHCGWNGRVYLEEEKSYTVPVVNNTELNDNALKWLNDKRGISKATAMRFKLFSEGREIGFPFYENDKIVHVKYRDAAKKFRSTKDSKLTLFGMQLEHDINSLIITEGELDAMSFYEAGHMAVSVPNGAKSHTWLNNCYRWVDQFKEIILAYDNDKDGIEGREEIARRLGRHRCKIFRFPEGIKDANELLVQAKNDHNWQGLFNAVFQYIEPFPVEDIISIDDLRQKVFDLKTKGYPKGESTGYMQLDELMKIPAGQLIIVTGIPSHGKSEFIDQLAIKLKIMNWLYFSPENLPYESHIAKLVEKEARVLL
jgi:twinkle protein